MNIVLVGLGFGSQFVPLYQRHPAVGKVGICDVDRELLEQVGAEHGVEHRFSRFSDALNDPDFDAVHIATPVPLHVEQTLQCLEAGKHCACAVPMATEIEDLRRIIDAQKRVGKNYMMMETAVYTREFLLAREMLKRGELGNLTFFKGAY